MDILEDLKKFYQNENSGHDFEHTLRVFKLAVKFANFNKDKYNPDIIKYTALLHDVDDYKIVSKEDSLSLKNANCFLDKYSVSKEVKEHVLNNIRNMGYHNALNGIIPSSIEGKYVSDADMCDSLGSHGLIRTFQYNFSKGIPFFNKDIYPIKDLDGNAYTQKKNVSAINHFFEKLLKLDNMMLTKPRKVESIKRKETLVNFLNNYFQEEDEYEWLEYLNKYLGNM